MLYNSHQRAHRVTNPNNGSSSDSDNTHLIKVWYCRLNGADGRLLMSRREGIWTRLVHSTSVQLSRGIPRKGAPIPRPLYCGGERYELGLRDSSSTNRC